ncbi:F-box domain containing protein [Parasponia andersonii]|uniref:F-box domain containing protein n=1 Tax=Parasponia andersonii TaxID=3476 RepID=A0A2P5AFL6_PARAD|nr:F-box domain containing protein [Parasponia andersonii]
MGQSNSSFGAASETDSREISPSRRFSFRSSSPAVISGLGAKREDEVLERVSGGFDYSADIPDECLALVFQFLGAGDRKRCSLVCKRWFRVDGQNRCRLSLNAQSEILTFLPSLFSRFDSVTKLALRCDRKSISVNDDALVLISIRCPNLSRVKLRGCREITDVGMEVFAQNCKALKKFSCGSCMFGAKGMNAILNHCRALEELSVKRFRGIHEGSEMIGPGVAASSLRSVCLKELINGQVFQPLIVGSKKLTTLKLIRCMGDWDGVLEMIGTGNTGFVEIHLERLQVSDLGLSGISRCSNLEVLRIVKTPECTNYGLVCVAEHCKRLRKLHIDAWRTNRIGDEGLIAVAKQCLNLQELVLIGVNHTSLGLTAVASSCQKLERLALCGSGSVGDAEIACIAAKCVALKKLCIKGCPISDVGIEALAWGCPNLSKIKVKKCRGVSGGIAEWLRERRESLIVNWDDGVAGPLDASVSQIGPQECRMEFHRTVHPGTDATAGPSSNGPLTLFRTKFGFLAYRNLVQCAFRRCPNDDNSSNGNL